MRRQRYCVYNQTSEIFLSLGALRGHGLFAILLSLIGRSSLADYDDFWITPFHRWRTLGFFAPRDLIYLDMTGTVVHMVESFSMARVAPFVDGAASLLVLPQTTIRSSHTDCGHTLLICSVSEMERKLRGMFLQPSERQVDSARAGGGCRVEGGVEVIPRGGRAMRRIAPLLLGWKAAQGTVSVDRSENVGETGPYLITAERWPIGTTVTLKLLPMSPTGQQRLRPILVYMRVAFWGPDGIGFELVPPKPEASLPEYSVMRVN